MTGIILCLPCLCYQRTIFQWRIWKSVQVLQREEDEAEQQGDSHNQSSSSSDMGPIDYNMQNRAA